jgi:hypothetical protein
VVHAEYHLVGKLECLAPRIPFGRIVFWRSMRLCDRLVDTGAASFHVAPLNNLQCGLKAPHQPLSWRLIYSARIGILCAGWLGILPLHGTHSRSAQS